MVTRGIWHQRNHKPCYTSDQLTSQAKEKLAEYFAVLPPILLAAPKPKERWKPPDASLVKINFDGAIFRDENRSGIGVVVRTHTGAILASLAQSIYLALHPTEIEAIAAARALEFGHELGLTKAVLEGDSELIVNLLKTGRATLTSVEPLIQKAFIFSGLYINCYTLTVEETAINQHTDQLDFRFMFLIIQHGWRKFLILYYLEQNMMQPIWHFKFNKIPQVSFSKKKKKKLLKAIFCRCFTVNALIGL